MSRAGKPRVAYYYNTDIGHYYYGPGHPMKPHRMKLTHHLIMGYGLYRKMECYRPHLASADELARFHSEDYVDFLRRVTPENCKAMTTQMQKYNIGEYTDCPVFDGLYSFCQAYGGASIDGAVRLNHGLADVAINWAGGLHHAKKCEASGFCYVNDIVLGILELLKHHQRVLYIDIDIHHGDGVEEAFYTTDRVMSVSFHKFGDFFPGTGAIRDIGARGGKGYSINFPLNDGIDDLSYEHVFKPVIQKIMEVYRPGAVALQCGADSLTGDRLGCFNLTLKGHAECVKYVRSFGLPTLLMGGGGYTIRNVARCWANETATVLEEVLPDVIPPNDYVEYYRPDYRLHLDPSPDMENRNSAGYLEKVKAVILENLRGLQAAPSVAFTERPPDWALREVEDEMRSLGGSLNPDVRPGQPGSDVAKGSGSLSGAPSMLSGMGGIDGQREHDAEYFDSERDIEREQSVPTGADGLIDLEESAASSARAKRAGILVEGASGLSSSSSAAAASSSSGSSSSVSVSASVVNADATLAAASESTVIVGSSEGSSGSNSDAAAAAAAAAEAAVSQAVSSAEAAVGQALGAAAVEGDVPMSGDADRPSPAEQQLSDL